MVQFQPVPDRSAPVVLYLPNESNIGDQRGHRLGLEMLLADGCLSEVHSYSLLHHVRAGGGEPARREVSRIIEEVQPDVVWLQHIQGAGLGRSHYRSWRSAGTFAMIYQEMDAHGWVRKPLPGQAIAAGRAADVVLVSGTGTLRTGFRMRGVRDVRWMTQSFDPATFHPVASGLATSREADVIAVANRTGARLPWRDLPGARERLRFISLLDERFGSRLGLYGAGWDLESARGPVPFKDQGNVINSGWVSANWDHYPREPRYFSNRLPISLATGGIHFTTWHRGYDEIFPLQDGFLHVERTPERLVDAVSAFLRDTSPAERLDLADRGRAWARDHLNQQTLARVVVENALGTRLVPGSVAAPDRVKVVQEHAAPAMD